MRRLAALGLPHSSTWRWVAAASSTALAGSLWLPWFHGEGDGGPYTETGWSSFDSLDIVLTSGAGIALLAIGIGSRIPSRRPFVPFFIGVVAAGFAGSEAILGHADHDPSAGRPEIGVFVALAFGLLLAFSARRSSHAAC